MSRPSSTGGSMLGGVGAEDQVNLVRSPTLRSFKGSSHKPDLTVVCRNLTETDGTSGESQILIIGIITLGILYGKGLKEGYSDGKAK